MRVLLVRVLLVLSCFLTLTTSAYAECAWVLWTTLTDTGRVKHPQAPHAAYSTQSACESEILEQVASAGRLHELLCLPDTIDPRGAKGRQ